jgi:hypothetical protein
MDNRTKFYCWLIGKLEHRRMTLQQICDDWADSSSNIDGKELSVRTFHRYREEIASLFGIEIECDKAAGYQYYIRRDRYANTEITEWLLSSLRIASLGDMLKYHDKVMLEDAPLHTEYLDDIVMAIDKHYAIRFHYRTPYSDEMDMKLTPAFIRLFRQRWYVIGNLMEQNGHAPKPCQDGSDYCPRVLPFDRMSNMEIVCEKQPLSKKTQELLRPDNFYDGCYGIIRQQNLNPRKIRIRVFFPENNYINEVPLHESQTKICDAEDQSYTDYELTVSTTRDFEQELLWHGRKIVVLSPDDFRKEMIGILKDMVRSYTTGENTVEE